MAREGYGDRTRPRPVDEEGSVAVGRNTESCEEIYRRSKRTMFLTENVSESTMFLTGLCMHQRNGPREPSPVLDFYEKR